jgi:hypothetical protein
MLPESATSGKRRPIPPVPAGERLATGALSPRHRMPTDLRLTPEPAQPTGGTSNGASRPGADHPITARPARRSPLRKGIERRILRLFLQQIPYACFDDQKPPQIQKDGQVGVVDDFSPQFGAPGVWIGSGRYMLINGGKIRSSWRETRRETTRT